jgi:flagellar hook-associated protein 2
MSTTSVGSSTPSAATPATSTTITSASAAGSSATGSSANSTLGNGILQSLGMANNINVNSLVSALMGAEQGPLNALKARQSTDQTKISALGTLSSALASLQSAAQDLESGSLSDTFTAMTASPSDASVLSVTTGTGAGAGAWSLNVTSLASSQVIHSAANYTTSDTFGTGTLKVSVGGTNTSVTINSSNNTLAGIASAINASGAGVSASVLDDGTSQRLVLAASASGTAGAITIAATQIGSAGTQSLTDFTYSGSDSVTMVQSQAAANASFTLNGIPITRPSNTITDVIPGVSFTLNKGAASSKITVQPDAAGQATAIGAFVTAYNNAISTIASLTAYDAASGTSQPLNGNTTVSALQSALPGILSHGLSGIAGGASTLADIGINLQADGTMSIDSNKLQGALTNPGNAIASLFGQLTKGQQGFATQIDNLLGNYLGPGGSIGQQTQSLNASIQSLTASMSTEQARLSALQLQYTQEFTAMDTVVSQMTSTQTFLNEQLQYANINAANKMG